MAVDHNNPQSRDEEILIATIDGNEYDKPPQSRMEELLLELKETIEEGGGGGGTTNYNNLSNQPQVNGETLIGDKTGAELGLVDAEDGKGLSTNDYDDTEKAAVAAATSAISAIKDGTDIDSFGDVEVALLDKADTSDLGTAAAKDSTNAVTSGSTDLVESGAVKDAIDAAVAAAYHHAGTKTVAQLTHDLLIAANEGNVYNITDSGTTTSDFIEGIGKTIDEGSNVGICKVGNTYMFDLLSGFVDTTNFVQKSQTAGLLKNDGTVNDEIEGDVESLKSGLTTLDTEVNGDATVYPYADVITIPDAVPSNLADCTVKIEPVQDLHGQSAPYVGGAGKNKLPLTVDSIKALNSGLTWNGNTAIKGGVPFTILTDSDNNVLGIKALGTSTAQIWYFNVAHITTTETMLFNTGNTYSWDLNKIVCEVTDGTNTYHASTLNGVEVPAGTYDVVIAAQNNATVDVTFLPMFRATTETDATFAPYTNYCPITGHTEASVQRDGKNWFNVGTSASDYTRTCVTGVNGNVLTVNIKANAETFAYRTQNLTIKGNVTIYYKASSVDSRMFVRLRKADDSGWMNSSDATISGMSYNSYFDGWYKENYTLSNSLSISIPNDCLYWQYGVGYGNAHTTTGANETISDIQIELGSTATPYVPYAGKTYTIALGDTIYGGTVDFDSGVMTVDREYIYVDGSDTSILTVVSGQLQIAISSASKTNTDVYHPVGDLVCNCFEEIYSNSSAENGIYYRANGSHNLLVRGNDYTAETTLSDWVTWLGNNPLQIVYGLATPTTIQLTPQQIQLLKGTNTLTASTGQISVTVNGVSGSIGAVQEQVNDIAEDVALKQNATDNTLQTTDKTVVGAVNELKSGLINKQDTISKGIISEGDANSFDINTCYLARGSQVDHLPDALSLFTVYTFGANSTYKCQMAVNYNGGWHIRNRQDNEWTVWKSVSVTI